MNNLIYILLAVIFHLVDCSINVTRGDPDMIYDETVDYVCTDYGAHSGNKHSCTCPFDTSTFYSNEGRKGKCRDLKKQEPGCLLGDVKNISNGIVTTFKHQNCSSSVEVTASFLWNLEGNTGNGTWKQLPTMANKWFPTSKGTNSHSVNIQGFISTENLKGQLVKLNLSCGKCLVFAINGTITYPFNPNILFPELFATATTASVLPSITVAATATSTALTIAPTPTTTTGVLLSSATTTTTIATTKKTTATSVSLSTIAAIKTAPAITSTLTTTKTLTTTAILVSSLITVATTTTEPTVTPTPTTAATTPPTTTATSVSSSITAPTTTTAGVSSSSAAAIITNTSTTTVRNTENDKNQQKDNDGVGAGVIAALVIISVVAVILFIIIVYMCRKREGNATMKGPVGNGVGSNNAIKIEDIYLAPVDTLHNNQFTYQDPGALADNNAFFNPEIGNPGYARKEHSAEHAGYSEENNLYSYIGENNYSQVNYDGRPRDESVLSDTSSTGLISNSYIDQQTRHLYSVSESEIGVNPGPEGLSPIEENHKVVSSQPPPDATPSRTDLTEPIYEEALRQEPIDINDSSNSQLPYENYKTLDTSTRTSAKGEVVNPASEEEDMHDSLKNNTDNNGNFTNVEFPQNDVDVVNLDKSVSSSNDGMLNSNYESDNTNFYHMLDTA